jgi:hypothetical protein
MVLPLRTRQGGELLRYPYRPRHPRRISGIGSVYLYYMMIPIYLTWVFVNRIFPGYKYLLRAHAHVVREEVPGALHDPRFDDVHGGICFPEIIKVTDVLLYQKRSRKSTTGPRCSHRPPVTHQNDALCRSGEVQIYFTFFLTYDKCRYTIYH